nr:hypothetical protein [[Eubacterium] cellulosolvens]
MIERFFKKVALTGICFLIAVLSIKVLSGVLTDPDMGLNKMCIEAYDNKIETTMLLTGTAAGASTVISLLPGDVGTPIATQLADVSKYFLIVLSALYFEKYFIVIAGFIVSYLTIPSVCLCVALYVWKKKKKFLSFAVKSALVGLVLALIVPCTVISSDLVANAYNETLENAQEFEGNEKEKEDTDGGILKQIKETGSEVVDQATDYLTSLLEALAVMLVVSCLIPILVLIIAIFILKMLLPQTAAVMQIENILPNRNKREAGEAALEMKCEPEE